MLNYLRNEPLLVIIKLVLIELLDFILSLHKVQTVGKTEFSEFILILTG